MELEKQLDELLTNNKYVTLYIEYTNGSYILIKLSTNKKNK